MGRIQACLSQGRQGQVLLLLFLWRDQSFRGRRPYPRIEAPVVAGLLPWFHLCAVRKSPISNVFSGVGLLNTSVELNMNRVPMTVSDLVEMTRQVNLSISNVFAGTGIKDWPVIDGVSNGWAGNSIYHQHFQFFRPEEEPPIASNPNL